jgi:hypothetical protein
MKLRDIMSEANWTKIIEEMLEPKSKRPPNDKGPDAIRVEGYVVHGHWRKRGIPRQVRLRRVK